MALPIPIIASRSSASCRSASTSDLADAIVSVDDDVVRGGGAGRGGACEREIEVDDGIVENWPDESRAAGDGEKGRLGRYEYAESGIFR